MKHLIGRGHRVERVLPLEALLRVKSYAQIEGAGNIHIVQADGRQFRPYRAYDLIEYVRPDAICYESRGHPWNRRAQTQYTVYELIYDEMTDIRGHAFEGIPEGDNPAVNVQPGEKPEQHRWWKIPVPSMLIFHHASPK